MAKKKTPPADTEPAPKKKKRKKERTQKKVHNEVVSGMRKAFRMYSPKYEAVKNRTRFTEPRYNKDGSRHKVDAVWFRCEKCREKTKDVDVDHIVPVREPGKTYYDYSLDELYARLDCDISNLQALCEPCHDAKTAEENKIREAFKKARK